METTTISKNWSEVDVFQVSRHMLREFARNEHLQHSQIMLDNAEYMIVCGMSGFGWAFAGVYVECWDEFDVISSRDYCELLRHRAEYFANMDLDSISHDADWSDYVAPTYYEVWHIVDRDPDWLPAAVSYSEYMRGGDSFLRNQLAAFVDCTVASDFDAGSSFVELYVFEKVSYYSLVGLMRMPWKSGDMRGIFRITDAATSKLGYSFAFRRFDVMHIGCDGLPEVISTKQNYVCMSGDYSRYMEFHKYDPVGDYVDNMRRCYDDEIPF